MKHPKLIKTLITVAMIALMVLLIYLGIRLAFPELWDALKNNDQSQLGSILKQGTTWKTLVFLAVLQFVQILSIILPSPPIHIAGGMVVGTLKAFATCHVSYCLANLTVFVLARKFSKTLEKFGFAEQDKSSKLKDMLAQGDPWIVVILACMVPIVPNGLIPYAAAQTDMKKSTFTASVFAGGFVPTFLLCAIGSNIMQADYPLILLLVSIDIICMWEVYDHRDDVANVIAKIASIYEFLKRDRQRTKAEKAARKAAEKEEKKTEAAAVMTDTTVNQEGEQVNG